MSAATIKLYQILVDKGVDQNTAREAVDEFLSKEEARLMLVTKDDLRRHTMWVAGMFVGQIAVNTGIMLALFQLHAG